MKPEGQESPKAVAFAHQRAELERMMDTDDNEDAEQPPPRQRSPSVSDMKEAFEGLHLTGAMLSTEAQARVPVPAAFRDRVVVVNVETSGGGSVATNEPSSPVRAALIRARSLPKGLPQGPPGQGPPGLPPAPALPRAASPRRPSTGSAGSAATPSPKLQAVYDMFEVESPHSVVDGLMGQRVVVVGSEDAALNGRGGSVVGREAHDPALVKLSLNFSSLDAGGAPTLIDFGRIDLGSPQVEEAGGAPGSNWKPTLATVHQNHLRTLLYFAASNGLTESVADEIRALEEDEQANEAQLLSASGSTQRVLDWVDTAKGRTALWSATFYGESACVQLLAKAKACLDLKNGSGFSPLWVASQRGHEACAAELLQARRSFSNLPAGALVDSINARGASPLITASMHGHEGCVKLLLQAKADLQLRYDGLDACEWAREKGHLGCVEVLTEAELRRGALGGGAALVQGRALAAGAVVSSAAVLPSTWATSPNHPPRATAPPAAAASAAAPSPKAAAPDQKTFAFDPATPTPPSDNASGSGLQRRSSFGRTLSLSRSFTQLPRAAAASVAATFRLRRSRSSEKLAAATAGAGAPAGSSPPAAAGNSPPTLFDLAPQPPVAPQPASSQRRTLSFSRSASLLASPRARAKAVAAASARKDDAGTLVRAVTSTMRHLDTLRVGQALRRWSIASALLPSTWEMTSPKHTLPKHSLSRTVSFPNPKSPPQPPQPPPPLRHLTTVQLKERLRANGVDGDALSRAELEAAVAQLPQQQQQPQPASSPSSGRQPAMSRTLSFPNSKPSPHSRTPTWALSEAPSPPPAAPPKPAVSPEREAFAQPFAAIDEVDPRGPAARAGLRVGDLVLSFGGVRANNHEGMQAVARLTKASEGGDISLLVQRELLDGSGGTERVRLRLHPHRWSEHTQGLLGCHIREVDAPPLPSKAELAAIDTDGDGVITRGEYDAFMAKQREESDAPPPLAAYALPPPAVTLPPPTPPTESGPKPTPSPRLKTRTLSFSPKAKARSPRALQPAPPPSVAPAPPSPPGGPLTLPPSAALDLDLAAELASPDASVFAAPTQRNGNGKPPLCSQQPTSSHSSSEHSGSPGSADELTSEAARRFCSSAGR